MDGLELIGGQIFAEVARAVSQRGLLSPDGTFQVRIDYSGTQKARAIILWQLAYDAMTIRGMNKHEQLSGSEILAELVGKEDYREDIDYIKSIESELSPEKAMELIARIAVGPANPTDGGRTSFFALDKKGKFIAIGVNGVSSRFKSDTEVMGGEIRMHDILPQYLRFEQDFKGGISFDYRGNIINVRRSICSEQTAIIMAWLEGNIEEVAQIYTKGSGCSQCEQWRYALGVRHTDNDHYYADFQDERTEDIDKIAVETYQAPGLKIEFAGQFNKLFGLVFMQRVLEYMNNWLVSYKGQSPVSDFQKLAKLKIAANDINTLLKDSAFNNMVLNKFRTAERPKRMNGQAIMHAVIKLLKDGQRQEALEKYMTEFLPLGLNDWKVNVITPKTPQVTDSTKGLTVCSYSL